VITYKGTTPNLRMHDLIPFSVAKADWDTLPLADKLDITKSKKAELGDMVTNCTTCRCRPGEWGFVRLPFPLHHRFFGQPICCPHCWPEPFGYGTGILTEAAKRIAAMWREAGET